MTALIGRLRRGLAAFAGAAVLLAGAADGAGAAASDPVVTDALTARLVTAENSVAPGTGSLSAGLEIDLADGWKTYWRSPGEVGFAPEIDWTGSENLAGAEILWPAPTRFRAFGIENYGYAGRVVLPLRVTLAEPGAPARLAGTARLLACATLCVPQEIAFDLPVPAGSGGIDPGAAGSIADFAARVPVPAEAAGIAIEGAGLAPDGSALIVAARGDMPFTAPTVFPESPGGAAFGAPELRLSEGGRRLWVRLPVTSPEPPAGPVALTITDAGRAAEAAGVALGPAPAPPEGGAEAAAPGLGKLLWISLLAFLGGMVLNLMPCVLPVLSIKLASAVKARGRGAAAVRMGFLVSALGVLAFVWVLAGATLAARAGGVAVGWGLQFQNPVFLAAMVAVLALFAANLAGVFEINLPSSWSTAMDRAERRGGHLGDFAAGAFAAVLATPCSAPFLGTAVAFAMAGRAVDVIVVFTALGLGLAAPYLAIAARPGLVQALPRPGRWMAGLRLVLGALLALTAAWLVWVLAGVAGGAAAGAVVGLLALALGLVWVGRGWPAALRGAGVAALSVGAVAVPLISGPPEAGLRSAAAAGVAWQSFERAEIARQVAAGQVVFVDVTADWCLTCKANKALVLDRQPAASALGAEGVVAMQADWTRSDPAISRYLARHGRYAIPFNAVYGPGAPEGIVLPELLSSAVVMEALAAAGAPRIVGADAAR